MTSREVPRGARSPRRGLALVGLGLFTLACLLLGTGLGPGAERGAGDNGDGYRLYCGAGLAPVTDDGRAAWKGLVVTTFIATDASCASPAPSSALLALRLAVAGHTGPWDLRRLAVLYVALTVGAVVVAGAAVTRVRPALALLLIPAVAPLALPWFSRFYLSTYGEPAGLLGAVVLLSGVTVVAVTSRAPSWTRVVGLVLTLLGGALAATAKPAYVALVLVALIVCAVSRAPRSRRVGALGALAVASLVAVPVVAAVTWQQDEYGPVNTHNLVLTAVGPASDGDALAHLGLPPTYGELLGTAYSPTGPAGFPDWDHVVGDRWPRLRAEAAWYVATHPSTAAALVGTGLRAATDPTLAYLPADRADDPRVRPVPVPAVPVGEQGAERASFEAWSDARPVGLVVLTLLAGAVQTGLAVRGRRRRDPVLTAAATLGSVSIGGGVLVAVAAVAGDGYFEIAKHTWLASYLGLVGLLAGAGTLSILILRHLRRRLGPEAGEEGGMTRSRVLDRTVPRSRRWSYRR